MPDLISQRKEKFCRRYVGSLNAAAAARHAGYAPQSCRTSAYRLLREPAVQARIAELQAEDARQVGDQSETLVGKLESVFRLAVEYHHFSAAVRIVEMQAKLAGIAPSGPSGGNPIGRRGKSADKLAVVAGSPPAEAANSNDTIIPDDDREVALNRHSNRSA
ncbi:MAG: terminase small subunit [Rhodospirillales bacterium]|nr:terminase small subunit [Rhodospirillales bacterium]